MNNIVKIINEEIQKFNDNTYKVYHGTNNEFDNFDFNQTAQGIIWFTDSKETIINQEHGGNGSKIIITANYRLGDIRDNYADLTKIRNKLGFEPKVSFKDGISKFVKWVNLQEASEDKFSKSIEEMKEKGLYK